MNDDRTTVSKGFDPDDPPSYFADPRTRKWVIQCLTCRRVGYRSDAPPDAFNRYWFERKLEPMRLDDMGRCEQCVAGGENGSRDKWSVTVRQSVKPAQGIAVLARDQ